MECFISGNCYTLSCARSFLGDCTTIKPGLSFWTEVEFRMFACQLFVQNNESGHVCFLSQQEKCYLWDNITLIILEKISLGPKSTHVAQDSCECHPTKRRKLARNRFLCLGTSLFGSEVELCAVSPWVYVAVPQEQVPHADRPHRASGLTWAAEEAQIIGSGCWPTISILVCLFFSSPLSVTPFSLSLLLPSCCSFDVDI